MEGTESALGSAGATPLRSALMAAIIMDGEALAAEVKADLSRRMEVLADAGVTPGLGTVMVGDDGPSAKYVSMKHADCAELGMHSADIRLPATATQADVAPRSTSSTRHRTSTPSSCSTRSRPGSTTARPSWRRPRQGRRRPASHEPGSPGHGGGRTARMHAGGHPRDALGMRGAGGRSNTWSSWVGDSPSAGRWRTCSR